MHFAPFLPHAASTAGRLHPVPRSWVRTGFSVAMAPPHATHTPDPSILLLGCIQNRPDAGERGAAREGTLASYLRPAPPPSGSRSRPTGQTTAGQSAPSSQAGPGNGRNLLRLPRGSEYPSPRATGRPLQCHACKGPPRRTKPPSHARRAPCPHLPFRVSRLTFSLGNSIQIPRTSPRSRRQATPSSKVPPPTKYRADPWARIHLHSDPSPGHFTAPCQPFPFLHLALFPPFEPTTPARNTRD